MKPEVAAFLRAHVKSHREEVLDAVAPYRGLDMRARGRIVEAVIASAAEILASRPDRERVLAMQDAPHPSYPAIIARLRARHAPRG